MAGTGMNNYTLLLILLWLPAQLAFGQGDIAPAYEKMLGKTYEKAFPVIQPQQAQALVGNSEVVFLDTRELEEYQVSHIPDAIHVGYQKIDWQKIQQLDRSTKIILYCSIGVRSQSVGKEMQKLGFTDVQNLYGGLFLWADQGRELVDASNDKTREVHGYSRWWGRWVKKADVVYGTPE
jgi:rhodanese-related sulfurtransferase